MKLNLKWFLLALMLLSTTIYAQLPFKHPLVPGFITANCWFESPAGVSVDCGYLVVEEDRSKVFGRHLSLAVAIIRAPGDNPEPDPVMLIHGGPAEGLLSEFGGVIPDLLPLTDTNRDVIVFDQRGVGKSATTLSCPGFAEDFFDALDFNINGDALSPAETHAYLQGRLTKCGRKLSGSALPKYNTVETAHDVNDMAVALGYDKFNVVGISFGGRAVQTLLRHYPERVRSAVIDSAVGSAYHDSVYAINQALHKTFAGCAADPACNGVFPDLKGIFVDVVTRLNANPVTLDVTRPDGSAAQIVLTGGEFTNLMRNFHAGHGAAAFVPLVIGLAGWGDYSIVADVMGGVNLSGLTFGAHYSFMCNEVIPFTSRAQVQAAMDANPEVASYFEQNFLLGFSMFDTCDNWDTEPVPAVEGTIVQSAVPAMVMRGNMEPIISEATHNAIAGGLSNGFGPFVYLGLGHIVSLGAHPCPTSMTLAFITDPTSEPDSSCMAQMSPVQYFIPF